MSLWPSATFHDQPAFGRQCKKEVEVYSDKLDTSQVRNNIRASCHDLCMPLLHLRKPTKMADKARFHHMMYIQLMQLFAHVSSFLPLPMG